MKQNTSAPKSNTVVEVIYTGYLALVCAISLLVSVIMVGSLVTSGVDFVLPRPSYVEPVTFDPGSKEARPMTQAELQIRQQREDLIEYNNRLRSLAHDAIYLLLTAAVYLGHRRLFRRRLKGLA